MIPEMITFLCTAKRKTYAGKGAKTEESASAVKKPFGKRSSLYGR